MLQTKQPINEKAVKKARKKMAGKKPAPGSLEAIELAHKIAQKHNLDFSFLKP